MMYQEKPSQREETLKQEKDRLNQEWSAKLDASVKAAEQAQSDMRARADKDHAKMEKKVAKSQAQIELLKQQNADAQQKNRRLRELKEDAERAKAIAETKLEAEKEKAHEMARTQPKVTQQQPHTNLQEDMMQKQMQQQMQM